MTSFYNNKGSVCMTKNKMFEEISCSIQMILEGDHSPSERLKLVCKSLKKNMPGYSWVGFYFVCPEHALNESAEENRELILGPFAGYDTDHKVIPFGKGVCGQSALKEETIIVGDVCKETNYLSCDPLVKSEIAVPIIKNEIFIGQIDVDSPEPYNFDDEDERILRYVCDMCMDTILEYLEVEQ